MESFDLYNLPDDVLFKSNEFLYDFVEKVAGKIEADILRVQGIRNARCLIRSTNLLAILELDCDEVHELKSQACCQCKTGEFIIKQGVQLNLDNLFDVLKEKHEKHKKKSQQHQRQQIAPSTASTPSTNSNNNNGSTTEDSPTETTMSYPSNCNLIPINAVSSVSRYTTINYRVIFIIDLIEKFSRKTFTSFILKPKENYDLTVTEEGPTFKATIKCQCGTKIILPSRSDISSFILSNFYAHLTTSNCSMIDQIFKEQEIASTYELEPASSSISTRDSLMSTSNDHSHIPEKRSKIKDLYNISSAIMPSSNNKKKQRAN